MERAVFGTILELREEKNEAGRNVATLQRHEVPTSRCQVNMKKKSTSGQRRDASTSRCQRDFSITIIKRKKGPEFQGIEERTNEGMKTRVVAT